MTKILLILQTYFLQEKEHSIVWPSQVSSKNKAEQWHHPLLWQPMFIPGPVKPSHTLEWGQLPGLHTRKLRLSEVQESAHGNWLPNDTAFKPRATFLQSGSLLWMTAHYSGYRDRWRQPVLGPRRLGRRQETCHSHHYHFWVHVTCQILCYVFPVHHLSYSHLSTDRGIIFHILWTY
jgi:hypothetical protein